METTESREYFRVKVRLPIEFRTISYDEYLNLENIVKCGPARIADNITEVHLLMKETLSKDEREKGQIYAYVQMIDKKLDMIIDLLSKPKDDGMYIKKYIDVNISGSGIGFVSDVKLDVGEYVELKIVLPMPPYLKITSLCKVARSKGIEINGVANWEVGLKFEVIKEDGRDLLINYIFTKERESLGSRKRLTG
ncbi:MAG: hypothetical protein A3K22_04620 [Deltaproteobacteria bacterium RBG_16_42_7]|nr:MAG: hypothetical protein A3K22_04620 [Deltaproteobacteria bacterium RBG_16_42_7]